MHEIRVLDINNTWSETGGGTRTYLARKMRYLSRKGGWSHAVMVPGEKNETTIEGRARLHRVRGFLARVKDAPGGYRVMWDLKRVLQVLSAERPHVIECASPFLDWQISSLARLVADPVCVAFYHMEYRHSHVVPLLRGWAPWARDAVLRLTDGYTRLQYGRSMDATFVGSRAVQKLLSRAGVDSTRLVRLGVDVRVFRPEVRSDSIRSTWGASPGDTVLMHAGRLTTDKGTDTVIRAAPALLEDPGTHLVFAGHGGLDGRIHELASRHRRVHHMGYIRHQDRMAHLLASADAYVGPGPNETFGLCIMEALACALPVVVCDRGAAPELARRSGAGLVFCSGDPESLVQAVDGLLRADRTDLAHRARTFAVTRGSWDRTFDTLTEHYTDLLERRRILPVRQEASAVASLPLMREALS